MDLTVPETPLAIRFALAEKLADSLAGAIPPSTPRQVHGTVMLPGKATALVGIMGMRRAGKTTPASAC